jgi:hypothetical protein
MAITLTEVEAAITAVQDNGQSVELDGMTYDAARLSDLIALRREINANAGRVTGTRPLMRRVDLSGMGY